MYCTPPFVTNSGPPWLGASKWDNASITSYFDSDLSQIHDSSRCQSWYTLYRFWELISDTLSKDRSHFFSSPDSIVHIQNAMKSLVPEVPVLAPVALNWALTMHRLFSSLTGGDEELPNSHIQAIVESLEIYLTIGPSFRNWRWLYRVASLLCPDCIWTTCFLYSNNYLGYPLWSRLTTFRSATFSR